MPSRAQTTAAAIAHLRRSDPVLGALIERVGGFTLRLQRDRFQMLVRSILSQQISMQAARSIRRKIVELLAPEPISPESLARQSDQQLRTAGLSPQKLAYIRDLCQRVATGEIQLKQIGRLPDEQVIAELTRIKGVGRWTAQMFLLFSLGRYDVFPHDDLGIRTALMHLYGLEALPGRETSTRIAEPWRPYASVATWYCWRSEDLRRSGAADGTGYPV